MNAGLHQALVRSLAEDGLAPRAVPYSPTSYAAFRLSELGNTYAIEIDEHQPSVEAARDAALMLQAVYHKEHVLIRETGEDGVKLHLFAVKRKSAARYVTRDHITRAVHDLYTMPVCVIDAGVIA